VGMLPDVPQEERQNGSKILIGSLVLTRTVGWRCWMLLCIRVGVGL
jgi:hypothetical protein